ncbi:hypothetical protein AVEN_3213-1, partial [Araneus ventricosus]
KQKPSEVGQNVKCNLQTGLVCWNKENEPEGCYDYEIRFYCPCPTLPPPTTTLPPPTLEPGLCVYGWTEWYNNHYPDGRGDYESIQSSRVNHIFCASDMITAVECRKAGSLETGLLQRGVECDLQAGLICRQESLGEQEFCWDYEVRFFCECPTPAPVTCENDLAVFSIMVWQTLPGVWAERRPMSLFCLNTWECLPNNAFLFRQTNKQKTRKEKVSEVTLLQKRDCYSE